MANIECRSELRVSALELLYCLSEIDGYGEFLVENFARDSELFSVLAENLIELLHRLKDASDAGTLVAVFDDTYKMLALLNNLMADQVYSVDEELDNGEDQKRFVVLNFLE